MFRARRRIVLRRPPVPPLIYLGTAALLSIAAGQLPAATPVVATAHAAADIGAPCPLGPSLVRAASARDTAGITTDAADDIDDTGTYVGQTLTITGAGVNGSISLPAESFVGARRGDALIYTLFDGSKSEVHAVDVTTGCDGILARPSAIIRSAVLDPAASAVYVHTVSSPGRADLGVTRYALSGNSTAQVVPPLPDDPAFGITFGTQLGWSTDGTALFVQSCGAAQCRTRLLNVASGAITTYDETGQGSIVGVSKQHVVAFAACDGSPCDVISIDRSSGATSVLAQAALSATLDDQPDGTTQATITTPAGTTEVDQ